MGDSLMTDRRRQALAWGAILIAIGAVNLIPGVPGGAGLLAVGAVLLALNLNRHLDRIPMNGISLAIGAAFMLSGAAELLGRWMGWRLALPVLPTLLIAFGLVLLLPRPTREERSA